MRRIHAIRRRRKASEVVKVTAVYHRSFHHSLRLLIPIRVCHEENS